MKRFLCAFLSIPAAMAAGVVYMILFHDEMDPKNPLNQARGPLVPMYRHFVENGVIVATTWPTAGYAFYRVFGTAYEIAVLKSAGERLSFLHVVAGSVMLCALALAIANGQPVQWRDALTFAVSCAFLLGGVSKRFANFRSSTVEPLL